MRAMRLERTRVLEPGCQPLSAVEIARPEPGPGQVLIEVHACAVCHTELDQIEGRIPTRLPVIPGHQVVGRVAAIGQGADPALLERRVGVGWIHSACRRCRWCQSGRENLCPDFQGTGCDANGGYAEFMLSPADYIHPIPASLGNAETAPMLCGGAIGLRSLRLARLDNGETLGLTGFGGSNHQVLKLARILLPDSPVMVWARDPEQQRQALSLGASWAGHTHDCPPTKPAAIIDTTPVWETVLAALSQLAPGGRLVINAIAKQDDDRDHLAELDYARQLWREKSIQSVANVTRTDIRDFLSLAASHAELRPEFRSLPLEQANQALLELRFGPIHGATVLRIKS